MVDDSTHEQDPTPEDEDIAPRRQCATMAVDRRLMDEDPQYARRRARIEDQAFRMQGLAIARPGCTKIPVVVHVVYRTETENVSQAQIDSQIAILNRDFRKKNTDVSAVPAAFAPLVGDARVVFTLASVDPQGKATQGVTRTKTTKSGFGSNDDIKFTAKGGHDAWPADEYLNLWVGKLTGGLLGYAQFPGGPAATDGVVVTHTGFGDTGTAAAPFNKGRTATHEIGHWLNLRHIWGDDGTGCSGSDFVDDTPNQGGPNVGVPTFPKVSCNNGPNGDMFMNYMDYVDDAAMVMFTQGQVTRMQACLDGPRSSIGEAVSCDPKPIKELVKELPKDPGKDVIKERPKELVKERPKEFVKELPKDLGKDKPKDLVKEPVKDTIKDRPKEFAKELPKDLAEVPGHVGIDPTVNPVLDPNMPFVMGTPSEHDLALAPPTAQPAPEPGLAEHYRLLLSHYAALHQAGLLDEAGLASWQQAWDAYRQLGA